MNFPYAEAQQRVEKGGLDHASHRWLSERCISIRFEEVRYQLASAMLAVLATLLISASAIAAERGFSNYDGDTFKATFRIANIDTPEIRAKCDAERELALRAKAFTGGFLKQGNVMITQVGIGKYGRVLATVGRGEEDLGEALIAAGLARRWKGRRESWCE
jgi:micrococcal nuclease